MPAFFKSQIARFLVVGVLTVVIDFIFYRLMFAATNVFAVSKAFGFICGTIFSYFTNRAVTFGGMSHKRGAWIRFAVLYLGTLLANVGINAAVLAILKSFDHKIIAAFLLATGTSATLNFLGMKFFVFQDAETKVV